MMGSEYHPALAPISWLFGVWESIEAEVSYPSMDTVKYYEVVEFLPTQEPVVEYKSETWHAVKKTKLHCERGFLRIDPESNKLALLVAHHYGVTEISEGSLDKQSILLESATITPMSFLKCATTVKVVRKLEMKGENLCFNVQLQTDSHPLQHHLASKYRKKQ